MSELAQQVTEPGQVSDEAPPENSFEAVSLGDLEFRTRESKIEFVPAKEEAALRSMFDGSSADALKNACEAINQVPKFDELHAKWRTLEATGCVAVRVKAVIDELEAPHLRPTGIQDRLLSGTHAACYGLFSLFTNISLEPP